MPDFWDTPEISYCLRGKGNPSAIDGLELAECTLEAFSDEVAHRPTA